MENIEIFFDNKKLFDLITFIYLDLNHQILELRD